MKLAIIGSRTFSDFALLQHWFNMIAFDQYGSCEVSEIISGGANGADKLGAQLARQQEIKLTEFIPDWEKHGKRAGFIRNEDIVAAADMVLAFWNGDSKGTGNSLSIAKRLKKPTLIIYF